MLGKLLPVLVLVLGACVHAPADLAADLAADLSADLPPGFASRFASANGVSLHYVEGGRGDTVVLLHGWPGTWRTWRKVLPLLAPRYHVIAIDLRGLGDSEAPATGYDKRTLARDVHALVHAVVPGARIHLVGHDLGAAVAYAYAKQFRDDVQRLVVMDDPLPGLADWDQVRGKWPRWHFAFHAIPDLPEQLVAGREAAYLGWFYRNAYQKQAFTPDDLRAYAAKYARPASLHAGFEYYRAFERDADDNRQDAATPLAMPVLALGGDHSPWRTYLHDQLAASTPTLTGDIVPDCGHFIPEEQPAWLATRLHAFFTAP